MQSISVFLRTRSNQYDAEAEYKNNKIIIKKGSRIKIGEPIAFKFPRFVQDTWSNNVIVDSDGLLLKDVEFDSISAAAQFVTKNSINGWKAWKTEEGIALLAYRKE